jgi:hypothetical protein
MKQIASRADFLLGLFFNPEDVSELFSRKVGLFSTTKKATISQKVQLFIAISMRT